MLLHDNMNDIANENLLETYVRDSSLQAAVVSPGSPVLGALVSRIGQKERPSCKYNKNNYFNAKNIKKRKKVAPALCSYRTQSSPQLRVTAGRLMNELEDRPMNEIVKDEIPLNFYSYSLQTDRNQLNMYFAPRLCAMNGYKPSYLNKRRN